MEMYTTALSIAQSQKAIGDAYLRFQIDQQVPMLLPMNYAQEVLVMPVHKLTTMPNLPSCLLGLMNRRSRVLWLVDLASLVGLAPLNPETRYHNVIVVRAGLVSLGLAVQEVKGVVRFTNNLIQSLHGSIAPEIAPYLQGCILQASDLMLIVDVEAIVRSPLLHQH